jgi:hypothetical protein
MSNYPIVGDDQRKPRLDVEGSHGVGKPCIVCSKYTTGRKWIQVDYMRGNDELVYVCSDHWRQSNHGIIAAFQE